MTMTEENVNLHSPLDRTEATWVSDWLKEIKHKPVKGGWMGLYRMSISDVSKKYHVPADEVISAARGEQRR